MTSPAEVLRTAASRLLEIADEVEADEITTVGPERLVDTMRAAWSAVWQDSGVNIIDLAADHARERLAKYEATTPASQVFADWFGAA